jgi:hypothetical protein
VDFKHTEATDDKLECSALVKLAGKFFEGVLDGDGSMPQYNFFCRAYKKEFSKILTLSEYEKGNTACPLCIGQKCRPISSVAQCGTIASLKPRLAFGAEKSDESTIDTGNGLLAASPQPEQALA